MNVFENLKSSIQNIFYHKLRSSLTMLGIIIGISAVVVINALGRGAKSLIMSEVADINKNVVTIQITAWEDKNYYTNEDIELLNSLSNVKSISVFNGSFGSIKTADPNLSLEGEYVGIDENYKSLEKVTMLSGRFFTEEDIQDARNIAIISDKNAMTIFRSLNCIGQKITLDNFGIEEFTVVGVYQNASKSPTSPLRRAIAVIPRTTVKNLYNDPYHYLILAPEDTDKLMQTATEAINLLHMQHQNENVYQIEKLSDTFDEINQIINTINTFIAFVAFISLFVGGIGVMNIMMVSVTERTREIGIRKALGATDFQIRFQFLIEALILTVLGGFIGILIGFINASVIALLIRSFTAFTFYSEFSTISILSSFIISSSVGIIFGVYPAYKASKLNPIDALRYE